MEDDRAHRAVRLTPAGRVFLTEARRHLRRSELAALAARRVSEGEAGSLAVGFTAAAAHSALDRLLKVVSHVVPAVEGVLRKLVTRDGSRPWSSRASTWASCGFRSRRRNCRRGP
ncbi:hypothetical protein [Streptomyces sp. NPDC059349]|uniref:hypothetical protein n=1 Tax=Streptomyces sp. NPDC059349 TaxID=3346808 RepID=UPI00369736D5